MNIVWIQIVLMIEKICLPDISKFTGYWFNEELFVVLFLVEDVARE